MSTTGIEPRVRELAASLFNVAPEEILLSSSPESIETWDSLQHLNLVLAIEQEFAVQLSPEEMERMSSIRRIVALLEDKTREQG